MNLASALFKQLLVQEDFDTWSSLRKHYLPNEYYILYDIVNKYVEKYHKLPSIEDLKLSVRDDIALDKIYSIETIEVDAEPFLLLEYLKNEFAQKETLDKLYDFVENSITFETAEETIDSLYEIIANIESKVELRDSNDNMQKLSLFDSEEEVEGYVPLGLNYNFDQKVKFKNIDYILMGGKRGSGKSITCSNLAHNTHEIGKSVLYFTIEMKPREILQRQCSIATGIPHSKIKYRNLDNVEWLTVAKWWASRYKNSESHLEAYMEHRDFDRYHKALSKEDLTDTQIDIIYDPELTLPKLRSEIIKRVKALGNVGIIIVDYVNQIKATSSPGYGDIYDWKEQIRVSKSLKSIAQELEIPVFSPYQIDASGEARFSKGILDSADAAFILVPGPNSIMFKCTKMRGDEMIDFTSETNWSSLKIGPRDGEVIQLEDSSKKSNRKASFKAEDIDKTDIYDDS